MASAGVPNIELMPTVKQYAAGTPSYVDLGTSDLDGASAFYAGLFGWEIVDLGGEAGNYRLCQLDGGKGVAGLGPQMNPGPPFWNQYITVDDIEASAAKVTAAGGTVIVAPMDVMTAGKMCVFLDSVGAPCSLWQAGESIGADVVNDPGTFAWSELMTRDLEAPKEFYSSVFGWAAEDMAMGEDAPPYTVFKNGERMICGMMAMDSSFPAGVPNAWSIYFAVDGTEAACARATALGGHVHVPPTDIPPGRFALLVDPQGAMFNVITFGAPPDDPNVG